MSLLGRIREGLSRTKQQIVQQFDDIVRGADAPERRSRAIDVATLDALEELLISADLGVAASGAVIAAVKAQPRDGTSLRDLVKKEIRRIFDAVDRPIVVDQHPKVALIVGVNGTGKTTTVGKLANLLKLQGQHPLICAADTFRAAAVEQLEIWAKRAGVDIVRARDGSDPAAVVFDAISSGKARGRDPILVDTAGRLHTRVNLMQELDLTVAGDFLVMAAQLIELKSRMLLPRDPFAAAEELEDPRAELVNRLLEHEKFKAAAQMLWSRATVERAVFTRAEIETDTNNPEVAVGLFDGLALNVNHVGDELGADRLFGNEY